MPFNPKTYLEKFFLVLYSTFLLWYIISGLHLLITDLSFWWLSK